MWRHTVNKLPISAFVICLNEAHRIGATLESLGQVADEIIVVDSGSTDGTPDIAAQYGAKVLHNKWPGYGPQKRFAEDQCTHDWVLNLDADEVLSDKLIEEIQILPPFTGGLREEASYGKIASPPSPPAGGRDNIDGYALKIRDCVPGESRPRAFAHMTKAVRLYNKTKGRYADSIVHDRVHFDDPMAHVHTLSAPVYHYSVVSMEQAIHKLNRYSTMQADDMMKRGRKPALLGVRLVLEFPIAFLKSYLLRGDILRGKKGFINAMTYAFSRFARVAKFTEQSAKK